MSIEEHIASLPPDSSDPIGRLAPPERDLLEAWGDGVTHSVWWVCDRAHITRDEAQRTVDFLVSLNLLEPFLGKVYYRSRLGDETVQRIRRIRRLEKGLGYPFWAQAAAVAGGVILVAAVIAGIATWACAR